MKPTSYSVFDGFGNTLCAGIEPHLARKVAQGKANALGQSVWLLPRPSPPEDDGEEFSPALVTK